jgi:hypothetical protein
MGQATLINEVLSLSVSRTWEIAKTEWILNEIYFSDEPETCLCGHFPIIELCELKNKENENIATVGNCCVKKFIGLPTDKIFQAVKRIRKDGGKSLNGEAIKLAYSKKWINKWEFDFYEDTFRKRKLSDKQIQKRKQINEKILLNISKDKQPT